ncbi:MAG: hypothetical protein ACFFAH_05770 [Promethearchaeota archaeon]
MSEKKKLNKMFIGLLIVYIGIYIFMSIRIFTAERQPGVTPISGLPEVYHMMLFFMILPPIFTIVAVLVFPRIFAPLLLKGKQKIFRLYNDAYIETDPDILSSKIFVKRTIYIFLLTLGFLAIVLPLMSNEVAKLFITPKNAKFYESEGLDLRFVLPVLFSITFAFILPIVMGLWSIGWALEDSGLIHYSGLEGQRERLDKLFEIEPTHLRYNGYLKGYAGISSIVFLISLTVYFMGFEGRVEDVLFVIITPLMTIIISVPAYIIYSLTKGKVGYLRKGLPEAKRITEADLIAKK